MEFMESVGDLMEDVAHKDIVLSLGLVQELNQFDSLAVFHDEHAHIFGLTVLLGPDGVFHEFEVLRNSLDFEILHDFHFCLGLLDNFVSLGGVWLENLHSVLNASFLAKFDHGVSAESKSSCNGVVSASCSHFRIRVCFVSRFNKL